MSDFYVTFGGDASDLEASLATAKASINAYAAELRNLAKEMQATGASADSALGEQVKEAAAKLTEAKTAASELKSEIKELSGAGEEAEGVGGAFEHLTQTLKGALGPLTAVKEGFGEIVEIVAAAFAAEKLIEFAKSMGELGEQTERTGQMLGLTPEEVGQLNYQFAMTGTSAENLVRTMARFQVSLAAARGGSGPVAAALHALGLSAQELISLPLPEQLEKIANAVSSFADGPTKTAALQALGRGFVELLPLLNDGAEGLDRLADQAKTTNSLLDEESVKALVDMQHGFVQLGASISGVTNQGFMPFVSATNGAVKILTDLAQEMSTSIKEGGDFKVILEGIADAIKVVETAIALLIQGFKDLDAIGAGSLNTISDTVNGWGQTVHAILFARGDIEQVEKTSHDANAKTQADVSTMIETVKKYGVEAAQEISTIWGTTEKKAEEGGEKGSVAEGGKGSGESDSAKRPNVPAMDDSETGKLRAQIDALTKSLAAAGVDVPAGSAPKLAETPTPGQWPPSNVTFGTAGPFSAQTSPNDALSDPLKAAMEHLSQQFGAFTVTSTTGGEHAPGSQHYSGNAIDVSTKGMDDAQYARLLADAIKAGFTGIGISPTHAHLDTRDVATPQVFADQPGLAGTDVHGATPEEWASRLAAVQPGPRENAVAAAPLPPPRPAEAAEGGEKPAGAPAEQPSRPTEGAGEASGEKAASAPAEARGEGGAEGAAIAKPDKATTDQWLADLDAARTKLAEIQDKQAGGDALQKTNLATEQAATAQKQSQVGVLQQQVAAAKEVTRADQARGVTGEKLTKDLQEEAKLKTELRVASEAATESELRLGEATAKNSGNAKAEYDAATKLANFKLQAAGQDEAAQNAAKQQLLAAETAYQNAVRAETIQTEQTAVAAAQNASKATQAQLNEQLKTHQITMAQWLSQSMAALSAEASAIRAAYDAELAIAGQTSAQILAIKKQEQQDLAKVAQQEQADQAKAAEASAAEWQKATGAINSAFDSQVDGLLTGTTTWQQAMKKILTSLTEDVIKFYLNWALTQAETMAKNALGTQFLDALTLKSFTVQTAAATTAATTQTAAVTTGVATQTAAVETGAAAQTAAQSTASSAGAVGAITGIVKSIEASSGQVLAGVAGFMAPVIGPAAPAAGAAAAAGVEASAMSLAAFDTGAWSVPHDQIAAVHAGEMIVPSKGGMASEFRSIASGGGFNGFKSAGASPWTLPDEMVAGLKNQFAAPALDRQTAANTLKAQSPGAWRLPDELVNAPSAASEAISRAGAPGIAGLNGATAPTAAPGKSLSVHSSPNINIHAFDSADVHRSLSNNQRALMKVIEQGVKQGAHHGLRGLR